MASTNLSNKKYEIPSFVNEPIEYPEQVGPIEVIGSGAREITELHEAGSYTDTFKVKVNSLDLPGFLSSKVDGVTITINTSNKLEVIAGAHNISSHLDTSATGAQLDELVSGSETTLHVHDISSKLDGSVFTSHENNENTDAVHLTQSEKTSLLEISVPDGAFYVYDDGSNDGKVLKATSEAGTFVWEALSLDVISKDGVPDYITVSENVITVSKVDLSTDVENKINISNLPGTPVAGKYLDGGGTWKDFDISSLITLPDDSSKFYNGEGNFVTPNYLTIGISSSQAAAGNHTHDEFSTYVIDLAQGITVSDKCTGLTEGVNYPTGWVIGDGGSTSNPLDGTANDLIIKHSLDKRLSKVILYEETTDRVIELRDFSAYDHLSYSNESGSFNYICIHSLTDDNIKVRIIIYFE